MDILLTSIGRRGYLARWFREALAGDGRVHSASSDPVASGLLDGDVSLILPEVASHDHAASLVEYCERNSIRAVVPLIDVDVAAVAGLADQLAARGTRVLTPSSDVAGRMLDKWRTQDLLARAGLEVAPTWLGTDAVHAARESGELRGAVVVKPRFGMGSIGVNRLEPGEDLLNCLRLTERLLTRVHRRVGRESWTADQFVVQEVVEGSEYGLDVINDLEGRFVATLARRKIRMRDGETFAAETVNDPDMDRFGFALAAVTRHPGILDVDVIRDADGRLVAIDLNPRFGGGYPFSHAAGADVPRAIIGWLRGEDPDPTWLRHRPGEVWHKVFDLQQDVRPSRSDRAD